MKKLKYLRYVIACGNNVKKQRMTWDVLRYVLTCESNEIKYLCKCPLAVGTVLSMLKIHKKSYAVSEKTLIDTKYGDTIDMRCYKHYGFKEIKESHIEMVFMIGYFDFKKPYRLQLSYVLTRLCFNLKIKHYLHLV